MTTKEQEFHQAIEENDVMKVRMLLNNGVSVNCSIDDMVPLQLAIARDHQEIAMLLIEKRCIITAHDQHERSLFEKAVMSQQWKVVASLLTNNVNPDKVLSFGDSPLCIAVELCCPELVTVLIDGNANVNSVNMRNESALYIACQEGHYVIARNLIMAGADVNRVHHKSSNFTPLIAAVANDNQDIVKLLIQNHVNPNAQDADGWTSLWHAYSNCNEEICTFLLEAGARVDIPNNEGETVIQQAIDNEDEDDFVELFRTFAKLNPLPMF